jgi:hypothetical protein
MLGLSSLINLLADADNGYEPGELAGIALPPLLIALLIFWIGVKLQHAGRPKWIKWIAVVPLVVGIVIGITPLRMFYFDQVYQDLHGGTWKKGILHASGVIMPVLGLVGLFVWNKWLNRQKFDEL